MAEKRANTNPFAEAERTLVEEIRAIPEVSGLFGDVETQVFGACDEDFAAKIEALIATGIGTGVVVACAGTAGTPSRFFGGADGASPRLADTARFRVEVKTRLLDAARESSATDVATAIVRSLDLAEFDAPFAGPVLYSATEVADFDDFSRVVTLSFEAKIALI